MKVLLQNTGAVTEIITHHHGFTYHFVKGHQHSRALECNILRVVNFKNSIFSSHLHDACNEVQPYLEGQYEVHTQYYVF